MRFAGYYLALSLTLLFSTLSAPAQTTLDNSGVLREVWTNVDGVKAKVSDLQNSPNFPGRPLLKAIDPDFRAPVNWGNKYGVRMRALLTPSTTGSFTFWVSGDDNCELSLGTNESAESGRRIAFVPGWTSAEEWDKYPEQKSEPIQLQAGKQYYIEAIAKEHGGGDSLSVASSQTGSDLAVISGSVIEPFHSAPENTETLLLDAGPDVVQYAPNLTFQPSAQLIDLSNQWARPFVGWDIKAGPMTTYNDDELNPLIELSQVGNYLFIISAYSDRRSAEDFVSISILPALDPNAGQALTEYWFGVRSGIDGLTNHPDYPDRPHSYRFTSELASRERLGDLYGARTRGFLLAPTTGTYHFLVSGDEQVEFHLSSDENVGNLQLEASVPDRVSRGDYFASGSQSSRSIQLDEGHRYAFELLHQEEWSDDHFSVAWQKPGEEFASEISLEFLAPPADAADIVATTEELNLEWDYMVEAGRDRVLYLPQNSVNLDGYAMRRRWGSDLQSENWTQVSGPDGVEFDPANDDATTVMFPGIGTYVLQYSLTTDRNTSSDTLTVEVKQSLSPDSGFLTREVWWYRSYDSVAEFRNDPDFPGQPDIVDSIPGLRQSHN